MKKVLYTSAVILGAFLLVASADTAYATDINVGSAYDSILLPLLMAVATAMAAVITAAAGYAVSWLRAKTGLQTLELDAHMKASLEKTITAAAGLLLNQLGNKLQGVTITVQNPLVGLAVEYALKAAPAEIAHFGLDKDIDMLKQQIIAKLPQIANTSAA